MKTESPFTEITVPTHEPASRTITVLKDDAPEWVGDWVQEAHGDEFPSDWHYSICAEIWEAFAEDPNADPFDVADRLVDIYNHDLIKWMSSSARHINLVDDMLYDQHKQIRGSDHTPFPTLTDVIRMTQEQVIIEVIDLFLPRYEMENDKNVQ